MGNRLTRERLSEDAWQEKVARHPEDVREVVMFIRQSIEFGEPAYLDDRVRAERLGAADGAQMALETMGFEAPDGYTSWGDFAAVAPLTVETRQL